MPFGNVMALRCSELSWKRNVKLIQARWIRVVIHSAMCGFSALLKASYSISVLNVIPLIWVFSIIQNRAKWLKQVYAYWQHTSSRLSPPNVTVTLWPGHAIASAVKAILHILLSVFLFKSKLCVQSKITFSPRKWMHSKSTINCVSEWQ